MKQSRGEQGMAGRLEPMPGLSGVHRMGRQGPGATVGKSTSGGSILQVSSNALAHWDACGVVHQHPPYLEKHQIMKDLV